MKLFSFFRKDQTNNGTTTQREPLYLFNTQSKEKELFKPLHREVVKMYNCGPTVYDYQHVGNLRPYVFADILKRVLLYNGYMVKQVINITDVGHLVSDEDTGEDKIEAGARAAGVTAKTLTNKVTKAWKEDLEKLNIRTESIQFTRATDYISEQIALIETLEQKGYTYNINDGVYFDTSAFTEYGKLGNIDTDSLKAGARVEANLEKRNPTDFAVWKFTEKGVERQQEWDSPWGKGFPGWHLECTAMIFAELGKQIDIHTGGVDHIPIHHNNEIAQAEAVTKKQYVKYWMHNGFITLEGQKISKSLGNTVLLRQVADKKISPVAYRYWLLTAHYRSPINFTWEALEAANTAYTRLLRIFVEDLGERNGVILQTYEKRFHERINDDLDTPGAIALLWELAKDENVQEKDKRITMLAFDKVLGLGLIEGHRNRKSVNKLLVKKLPDEIRKLIEERTEARAAKEWQRADELRSTLESKGYTVKDTENGSEVERRT